MTRDKLKKRDPAAAARRIEKAVTWLAAFVAGPPAAHVLGPLGAAAVGASAPQVGGLARRFVEAMSELKASRAYEGMADLHEDLEAEDLTGKLDDMKDVLLSAMQMMGDADEDKRQLIRHILLNLARKDDVFAAQIEAEYALRLIGDMHREEAAVFGWIAADARESASERETYVLIPRDQPYHHFPFDPLTLILSGMRDAGHFEVINPEGFVRVKLPWRSLWLRDWIRNGEPPTGREDPESAP